ncbi:MAG: hypothetical protein ACI9JD_000932 [Rhodococcus sp. (in: high G+C Gram-positive bacteria)]|jgi:hypothetical protein
MQWLRAGIGIIAGGALWVMSLLASTPDTLCQDNYPAPDSPGPGYFSAVWKAHRLPLPVPAARCTTHLVDVDSTATSVVVDWPMASLGVLGITLVVVSLLTLKRPTEN